MMIPPKAKTAFECLHLDFGEKKKKSDSNSTTQSFLVVVDEHTRFTFAKPMKESSKAILTYLKEFKHIDSVRRIVTDNGLGFMSNEIAHYAKEKGIIWTTSASYHPEGNGLAERKVRDLKQFLALYPSFKGGWRRCLDSGVRHLNRSHTAALGCSPYFKAYDKISLFPADTTFGITEDHITEMPLSEDDQKKYCQQMKEHFDRRHAKLVPKFEDGGLILVQTGFKGKEPVVKGPYKLTTIKRMDGYPKTLFYEDEKGKTKKAAVRNVPTSISSQEQW